MRGIVPSPKQKSPASRSVRTPLTTGLRYGSRRASSPATSSIRTSLGGYVSGSSSRPLTYQEGSPSIPASTTPTYIM